MFGFIYAIGYGSLTDPSPQRDLRDNDNPKLQEEIRLLLDVMDRNERRDGIINNHSDEEKQSTNERAARGKYTQKML